MDSVTSNYINIQTRRYRWLRQWQGVDSAGGTGVCLYDGERGTTDYIDYWHWFWAILSQAFSPGYDLGILFEFISIFGLLYYSTTVYIGYHGHHGYHVMVAMVAMVTTWLQCMIIVCFRGCKWPTDGACTNRKLHYKMGWGCNLLIWVDFLMHKKRGYHI